MARGDNANRSARAAGRRLVAAAVWLGLVLALAATAAVPASPFGVNVGVNAGPPEPGGDLAAGAQHVVHDGPLVADSFAARALEHCQLPQAARPDVGVGFPRSDDRAPSTGVLTIGAIFVEFPDVASTTTTSARLQAHWPQTEAYLESQSYGRLDVRVRSLDRWLTMSQSTTDYGLGDGVSSSEARAYSVEAIGLADPWFDFTGVDIVWIIPPPEVSGLRTVAYSASGGLAIEVDGGANTIGHAIIRAKEWSGPVTGAFDSGEALMAHETLHSLGLADLYSFTGSSYPDVHRFVGNFDPMGIIQGFADGQLSGARSTYRGREIFAWHRWQLGWIDNAQIHCLDRSSKTATVTPLSDTGGTKAIVGQIGETAAIVAEARATTGYDRDLSEAGVLVYAIDSSLGSGFGPIQVQGSDIVDWPAGQVLLSPGERMDLSGQRVQVISAVNGGGFQVGMAPPGDADGSGGIGSADVKAVLTEITGGSVVGYLDWAADLDSQTGAGLNDARLIAKCSGQASC